MLKQKTFRTFAGIAILLLLTCGCTPNVAYRTDYQPCISANPVEDCSTSSLQEYTDPKDPERAYMLGIVEFDDQGQLYDRKQMSTLLDHLYDTAAHDNVLISVFVHGWHHRAKAGDNNIVNFRQSLLELSKLEHLDAKQKNRRPRKVVGVYAAWRGESVPVPVLNVATFYSRKNVAQKVGHGGVTELLSRLEEVRDLKESIRDGNDQQNRLVVIGHSFGGAVVYSALSQILMERFVDTKGPVGTASTVRGFADLVILINPAFEALQFATLSDMANERGSYFSKQVPVLAVLTSETDYATKYAFWAGRAASTLFKDHRKTTRINKATGKEQVIKQGAADRTAIGHFEPYRTHRLNPDNSLSDAGVYTALKAVREGWELDAPGRSIHFPGSVLEHLDKSVSRNPYLLVQVDHDIIPSHNDIYDPRVIDFLSYLIMISITEGNSE